MRGNILGVQILVFVLALSFCGAALADQDSKAPYVGAKVGYNSFGMMVDTAYEEHPDVSASHMALYAGYTLGIVNLGGSLYHYFLSADDGVWRMNGASYLDQTYVEFGSSGVIGPSFDVSFNIPIHERVHFNPGIGLGIGFRYGDIKQYDYETAQGAGGIDEDDLEEDDVKAETEDNGKSFMPIWPLFHIDADWKFIIDDNWYATLNLGFETFGPSIGIGAGYHF
jgi:hypothetical protein